MTTPRTAALLPFLILPLACNSKSAPTPQNYTETLNAYFNDHPDCLLDGSVHFPYETGDPTRTAQMEALTTAEMLESKKEPAIHIARYTLTPAGERAAPRFCFGHREITSIDASTTPAKGADGFLETHVQYHYKMGDTPTWAKTPQVVAAFPQLAVVANGQATGQITLAGTGVGWSVPD